MAEERGGSAGGTSVPRDFLSIDTVVAQAVQADVWEVGQAMVLGPDPDPYAQLPGDCVEHVDGRVVAARSPQLRAVRAELQHVRASATGDDPLGDHAACREVDDRDGALEPVGHVQRLRVA